jgi:hypothetical protein
MCIDNMVSSPRTHTNSDLSKTYFAQATPDDSVT